MRRRPLWAPEYRKRERAKVIHNLVAAGVEVDLPPGTRFALVRLDAAAAEQGRLDRADPEVRLPGEQGEPVYAVVHGGEFVVPESVLKAMRQEPPVFGGKPDVKPDPWPRPKKRKHDA